MYNLIISGQSAHLSFYELKPYEPTIYATAITHASARTSGAEEDRLGFYGHIPTKTSLGDPKDHQGFFVGVSGMRQSYDPDIPDAQKEEYGGTKKEQREQRRFWKRHNHRKQRRRHKNELRNDSV